LRGATSEGNLGRGSRGTIAKKIPSALRGTLSAKVDSKRRRIVLLEKERTKERRGTKKGTRFRGREESRPRVGTHPSSGRRRNPRGKRCCRSARKKTVKPALPGGRSHAPEEKGRGIGEEEQELVKSGGPKKAAYTEKEDLLIQEGLQERWEGPLVKNPCFFKRNKPSKEERHRSKEGSSSGERLPK